MGGKVPPGVGREPFRPVSIEPALPMLVDGGVDHRLTARADTDLILAKTHLKCVAQGPADLAARGAGALAPVLPVVLFQ